MGIRTFAEADTTLRPARSYADRGRPMLLIAEPDTGTAFEVAIAAVGGRLLQRIGWHEVAATLPLLAGRQVILA